MRSLRSMLISGWVVLILLATAGFAAYSTRGSAPPPRAEAATAATSAPAPALPPVSARVGAFILAESLGPAAPVAVLPDPAPLNVLPGPDGIGATVLTTPEPTTTATADTTTSTTAPATTTSSAPTTTEAAARSAEPAPTTTAAPTTTTTAAPTTTEAPASTTTVPAEGTTTTVAETTTTTSPPAAVGSGVERWRGLVSAYFPANRVDEALRVIECESRGDPTARNPYSGASGLFQFMSRTWSWASEGAGFGGADVYDPEANVASAAWLVDYSLATGHSGGAWGHWNCKP